MAWVQEKVPVNAVAVADKSQPPCTKKKAGHTGPFCGRQYYLVSLPSFLVVPVRTHSPCKPDRVIVYAEY